MKTRRLLFGLLAAVPVLASPANPTAVADVPARGDRAIGVIDRGDAARNAAYWTAARMAAATPLDDRGARPPGKGDAAGIPAARLAQGSRVVGALFFDSGRGKHYCTASVIFSPGRSLILTAAHCLYDPAGQGWHSHIVFVPKYDQDRRPYGVWPVRRMAVDGHWADHGDEDFDFGFAAVWPVDGRRIVDVVGANRLLIGAGYDNAVTVIGYPSRAKNPADGPIRCESRTHRQADRQLRFDCRGFFGGTSGSPLMVDYDERSENGYVIGVIGGYERGGVYDWRSYSAVFGPGIASLIESADRI